jgi:polar amino acid transport system substrate-binding protein
VTLTDRFSAVQQGKIDLLCGADAETLPRRREVAFSIPIVPSGIGALLRADAPARLKEILSDQPPPTRPNWRAQVGQLLQVQTYAVIAGTTAEPWLAGKQRVQAHGKVAPVKSYEAGIQQVLDRKPMCSSEIA